MAIIGIGSSPYFYGNSSERLQPTDLNVIDYMTSLAIDYDDTLYFSGLRARTGKQLWWIIDDLWANLTGTGAVNNSIDFVGTKGMFYFHPVLGDNADRQAYNLIDTATHKITWGGGAWTHDSNGAVPGASSYGDPNLVVSDFSNNNLSFGRYNGGFTRGTTQGFQFGIYDVVRSHFWGIYNGVNDDRRFFSGDNSGTITDDFGFGLYSVSGNGTNIYGYRIGQRVTMDASASVTTGKSDTNLYKMFYNGGNYGDGSPWLFDGTELLGGYGANYLNDAEMQVLSDIFDAFNDALGRRPQIFVAYGDSITAGSLASVYANSWMNLYCQEKGYKQINLGVSGTTMEKVTPQDVIDAPNFYDRRLTVKTYYPGWHVGISISYGVNDNGLSSIATYNTTTFSSQFEDAVEYINSNQGWPYEKMIQLGGFKINASGWNNYLVYPGVTAASTTANYDLFIAAAEAVALSKGMIVCNVRAAMNAVGAGAVSGDGLHPTDSGHQAIQEQLILDTTSL